MKRLLYILLFSLAGLIAAGQTINVDTLLLIDTNAIAKGKLYYLQISGDTLYINSDTIVPGGGGGIDTLYFDLSFEFRDVSAGTAMTYTLDIKASFDYTILSACLETDDGTLTGVHVDINSTAVTGLDNLTVDTGVDECSATSANAVTTGDRIYLKTSAGYSGTPTLIRGKIKMRMP